MGGGLITPVALELLLLTIDETTESLPNLIDIPVLFLSRLDSNTKLIDCYCFWIMVRTYL